LVCSSPARALKGLLDDFLGDTGSTWRLTKARKNGDCKSWGVVTFIPMSAKVSRGVLKRGKKLNLREERRQRKANRLQTGKLYTFLGATDIAPIFSGPSPLSRIIGRVTTYSIVMFVEATPWSSYQSLCMMVKVIHGELIGYLACYYDPEQPFQAHKFFKVSPPPNP